MPNTAYQIPFRSIGEDVFIWERAKVVNPEVISIGNSVIIDDFVFIMGGKNTEIGSFVHIASHTTLVGGGELILEDFSGLSGGVRIYTGNEDYLGGCLTNPAVPAPYRVARQSYVHIRKHAIIGANAVILPGVTIGEGAVVGSLSFVTRDIAPWTINVGSPAKPIRERPRERMLELEAELRRNLYDATGVYKPRTRAREM